MCELFGITSQENITANDWLHDFYSHSSIHKDGWGLAVIDGAASVIEKEPRRAMTSFYLKQRLKTPVTARTLMAHIRLATIGTMDHANCHPFKGKDLNGRVWTMMHNGSLFEPDLIAPFFTKEQGTTDSEGILLYLLDQINKEVLEKHRRLLVSERFDIVEKAVKALAPGNKLNLIIFDGQIMYVHTNEKGTLHKYESEGTTMFSTSPLKQGTWRPLPLNTLLAYKDGILVRQGSVHPYEFRVNEHDLSMLHSTYAGL